MRHAYDHLQDRTVAPASLGRFGHHPNPATDFLIEVDCLEGMAADVGVGFGGENGMSPEQWKAEYQRRLDDALTFRVGGVEACVIAKNKLRQLIALGMAATMPLDQIQARPAAAVEDLSGLSDKALSQ